MRKIIFVIYIAILLFVGNIAKAETGDLNIVYLHSDTEKIADDILDELRNEGVGIQKINVDKLDYMKYFYLYQNVYDIPDNFAHPLIISGNKYYVVENNDVDIQDIVLHAHNPLKSLDEANIRMIVYFDSGCSECKIKDEYVGELEKRGVKVVRVDTLIAENEHLFYNYADAYRYTKKILSVKITYPTPPMIFAGDEYFHGDDIKNRQEEIYSLSIKPLKDVYYHEVNFNQFEGFIGLLLILLGGLIDGVNPCAMAMLILFVGIILGSDAKKSTLINISVAYITGLFSAYFLLGIFLIRFISDIRPYTANLQTIINIFIIGFSLFFFFFNIHDFFAARKKEYKKIKNQLPKAIQKLNKKLINVFTRKMQDKNLFLVYLISFSLAVIIAFTEFLCTGQIYLPIILMISESSGVSGVVKLLLYNIMFVVPLIILAYIAVKARSAMETSNIIREKMHIIKLITGFLFLGIALYYLLFMFGVM